MNPTADGPKVSHRKRIVGSLMAVLATGLVYLVWLVASAPEVARDCYAQWDTAELIIRFHRQHHRAPASWEDVQEAYGDGSGLRGGMNTTQLEQRLAVEFARIGELETLARSSSAAPSLPEIVQARSGRQIRWSGAEPNRLIYDYFRELGQKQ